MEPRRGEPPDDSLPTEVLAGPPDTGRDAGHPELNVAPRSEFPLAGKHTDDGHRIRIGPNGAPNDLSIGASLFWLYSQNNESTDDAQIDGHLDLVSARIGGTVPYSDGEQPDRQSGDAADGA
jgi:hypothetical protein